MQDPVTKRPAVMVKKRSITRQKQLDLRLDQQQLALQRQVALLKAYIYAVCMLPSWGLKLIPCTAVECLCGNWQALFVISTCMA